jgi:hypothetical protein
VPDALDADADDDGVGDGIGGAGDQDCDERRDFQDRDSSDGPCADPDGDGLTNEAEDRCGSDPHGRDSDGDGLLDPQESCDTDTDCDQLPDRIDAVADEGFCFVAGDDGGDAACVDADPGDAWHDCPGHFEGGCATAGGDTGLNGGVGTWLAVLLLRRRRR